VRLYATVIETDFKESKETGEMLVQSKTLYDTDFNQWIEETVKKLQNKDFEAIDLENLIEEVKDLSRNQKNALKSLLMKLFEHLLKLTYWESERDYNGKHWKAEIRNFRIELQDLLKDSPSLKPYLVSVFSDCYQAEKQMKINQNQPESRKVLICQNLTCRKYGCAKILEAFLRDPVPGVEIVGCGCLGQCGNGPMVLILPDEVWYWRIKPADVPMIIENHLRHQSPVLSLLYTRKGGY
jgi:(2Fe-2S) ferredoxin